MKDGGGSVNDYHGLEFRILQDSDNIYIVFKKSRDYHPVLEK